MNIEEKIKELKSRLNGEIFHDMAIKDEIHRLEMQLNNVEPSCSMDEDCLSCGA